MAWIVSSVITFLASVLFGFMVTTQILLWRNGAPECIQLVGEPQPVADDHPKLLFVGVMTAQKYLSTRALAIQRTWGRSLQGRLAFFSCEDSHWEGEEDLPLVSLQGVDDSYPPQKKSFLMLKYMHDHLLDQYEWFMRSDDDVYVHVERMERFLRSVNSSRPQYIGQAGLGNKEEFGQLSLEPDENFCMGGPGVLFSRETLRRLAPHVSYCLKNLYSTHEDVEVGRCVRRFVGIPCTWSYEMQTIFYHNFFGEVALKGRVRRREVHRALTLHPIKDPMEMYRVHAYFLGFKAQELRHRTLQLLREMRAAAEAYEGCTSPLEASAPWCTSILNGSSALSEMPSVMKFSPHDIQDILTWDFFSKNLYSDQVANPRRRFETQYEISVNNVISDLMELTNRFSKQRGRVIEFKDILYGYVRVDPLHGADYILDLLLTYRKYKGRKMTLPVRRHAYIQQAFSQLQIRDITPSQEDMQRPIRMILPLSGRKPTFERFLSVFRDVCLQGTEDVVLAVIQFPDGADDDDDFDAKTVALEMLGQEYDGEKIKVISAHGEFARASALQIGAEQFSSQDLLFFIDVDMVFDAAVLRRVRWNTVLGKTVYFPIVFSQYNPSMSGTSGTVIDNNSGYWRQFGFGIVSIFHADLKAVGGMDVSIQGWGKEDVDLYDRVLQSNLTVIRAPDPGLIHVYHAVECNVNLPQAQYDMCLGSKWSNIASERTLAKLIAEQHSELLKQNFRR